MLSRGKKALLILVGLAMLTAFGILAYTSRQAAEARENPNTHAGRIQRALQQAEKMTSR